MNKFVWMHRKCLYEFTHFPYRKVRVWALRRLGFSIGEGVYIAPGLTMAVGYADTHMQLTIGNRVSLGPNVTLILATHPNNSRLKSIITQPPRRIHIGDDTWIGANAVILPNIQIGKCCIIGAGAVVTHDVPDFSVVAGVPARIIKTIDSKLFK